MTAMACDEGARLYFDDLKGGQRFSSGAMEVEKERIKGFALEYDPQPFHLDDDLAKGTMFGGLAASGWQTAALTMRLLVDGGLPIAGGLVGRSVAIKWPHPTRPGDVLHVDSEIIELTPSRTHPDRGTVSARGETINQRGEIVQVTTVKLIVGTRARAA